MSRPKSMSDFASLLDASYTPVAFEKDRPRKKPSISLAAGLIMAEMQSPKTLPHTPQQTQQQQEQDGWSEGLFYAYAQKVYPPVPLPDYSNAPPYILTFASAAVANQWWNLVKTEYPESTRPGPQLFILKGDDMQEQIQDNPRFYDLRNRWFYTASAEGAAVIPIQDWKGNPLATSTSSVVAQRPAPSSRPGSRNNSTNTNGIAEEPKADTFDMSRLSETLDKMNAMISSNSAAIQALSVAQSEGLSRMQEINESNSTQIKALADGQAKLQSMMDQNATHYIALSNSSFSNQEAVKTTLQRNADQIRALADGQHKLATTCTGLMKTIEKLGNSVGTVNDSINHLSLTSGPGSDAGSTSSIAPFSAMANRISPPPRKLNRKVKGVWYEYDTNTTPTSSPRRSVTFLDTPPKSPPSSLRS
ncbi:hypothetical protein K491DRAFT_669299 [Lophiostoma macrostomum CBS 122681]|uniref:Uncharacterized protein n=1 Tax=Lophiostoma macrostomum CBS 122681 TaxID=1314788 RepID=A0A6A6SN24_9PLEO|nr:hypothetical protein K491DRAFT_669299 [Lophiostoma macrostomum CBS 122681]